MIATAFDLPKEVGEDTINHEDRDKSNNNVGNLSWASVKGNNIHARRTNLNRKSHAPALSKPVRGRRVSELNWTTYPSASDAARQLKLDNGNVRACCIGKHKKTGGFEFEFDTSNEPEILDGEVWREIIPWLNHIFIRC